MRITSDFMLGSAEAPSEAEGQVNAFQVRLLTKEALPSVIAIDRKFSGRERTEFFHDKYASCVGDPGINTSLVAMHDGTPVGFLFGQLFFGEFGIPSPRAVLDTFGVLPSFLGKGVARALLSQYRKNLEGLRVEAIDTLVAWDRPDLLSFFHGMGFHPSRNVDLVWDTVRYPFAGRGSDARIRPATEHDLPAIAAIAEEAGLTGQSRFFTTKLANARARPGKNLFIVAEHAGEPAAYLVGRLFYGEFGIDITRGVIDSFAVREAFHHQGIGSAVMGHLLERVRKLKVTQMETLVRWNHWEILQFLEYVGFRPSARINLEWRFAHARDEE
jgi:GNAT superfamily N-acetyltransferase